MWADLDFDKPIGFHSSDNGAIHVALLKWFKGLHEPKVRECIAFYYELKDSAMNLDPYWEFVYCARRALGIGEWEDAYYENDEKSFKDVVLKTFREKGLELQNKGLNVKIYPRFQAFMVDWVAGDKSKSAVFWHGVKTTEDLRKHWQVQRDNTVFPKCEFAGSYNKT